MTYLGLSAARWLLILNSLILLFLGLDALAGHFRRGFQRISQWLPIVSTGALVVLNAALLFFSETAWIQTAVQGGAIGVALVGLAGFFIHHYFGFIKKPGGYAWWLHHLMYGPPVLAPLALCSAGLLAWLTVESLTGSQHFAGVPIRDFVLLSVAVLLSGAILQSLIYHFRGAFNNLVMFVPMSFPLLNLLLIVAWLGLKGGHLSVATLETLMGNSFWLTMATGFVGLGMHLRGFDRQMGGLHLKLFNLLEGPPAWAPGLFAWMAGVGLVATYLM